MRVIISIALGIVLACGCVAWAQQTPMYDPSYSGPTNYYGQPTFQALPRPRGQAQQQDRGAIPLAISGVQQLGSYFWSYMPAPIRGQQQTPYVLPPDAGQVTVNLVPGSP